MKSETAAVAAAKGPARHGAPAASERVAQTPWVVNLRAAMTSLRAAVAPLPGLERLRVYEVAQIEDGRPRHRLRVGLFACRRDAEDALKIIRATYPTAFAAPAARDDLAQCGAGELTAASARALATTTPASPRAMPRALIATDVLELLEPQRARTSAVSTRAADVHRSSNAATSHLALSLATDDAPTAAGTATDRLANPAALDDGAEWFALELVASSKPSPARLPRLDIFAAYALYTVEIERDEQRLYAVRLGFFRERVSAGQVASYVRSTFPDVAIVGVSAAEQGHYSVLERADALASFELCAPESNVIELTRALSARPTSTITPTTAATTPKVGGGREPRLNSKALQTGRIDTSRSGKHRTLGELLLEEARQVALSETAIRRMPAHKKTLFDKLVRRLKS